MHSIRRTITIAAAGACGAAALAVGALAQAPAPPADLAYGPDGKLIAPAAYREWVFLSAGLDMTYGPAMPPAGQHRFDNVFVNPAAYRAFKATGAWPDRTVMVLEIRNAVTDSSINRAGHVQTDVAAVELHVKDQAKGGWAFYGVNPAGETRRIAEGSSCHSCHEKSGGADTTFVQFYPTLIPAAQKAGTLRPAAELRP